MVWAGFPAGGALESANINVSVAILSRAPSGREMVTGDADVLILCIVEYMFAKGCFCDWGLPSALRSAGMCMYKLYICAQ